MWQVLDFLFRDVNEGGSPDNWELLAYVAVDNAHFGEVFEDDEDAAFLPLFKQTYNAVRRRPRSLRARPPRSLRAPLGYTRFLRAPPPRCESCAHACLS